jgi:hypothetical protein
MRHRRSDVAKPQTQDVESARRTLHDDSAETGPLSGRHAGGAPKVRYRKPADRRSKPKQWDDAVGTLLDILDDYQDWRDRLPPGVADSPTADRLDEVLALRDLVEQLQGVELPKDFGRDT